MKNFSPKQIATAAIVAAFYAALTIPLGALSSQSLFQIRPAEALTMLPLFLPEAIPGLAIGCALANIFGGYGIYDIVFGSLITLAAAFLTRIIKKPPLAGIPPVLLNAIFLPLIWIAFADETVYLYSFLSTLLTQTVWVYGLGLPMCYVLKKRYFKDR